MPLNRTPAKTPAEPLYDSEPDLHSSVVPSPQPSSKLTQRFKRKYQQGDDITTFMNEIKTMFQEFTQQQEEKYNTLLTTVTEIKEQYCELHKTILFVSAEYDEMKAQLRKLETENADKVAVIKRLEEKVEQSDVISKLSCIEIRNIPENKGESKSSLSEIIISTGKTLDIEIKKSEIRDIYRLKPKVHSSKSANTIVVDLTTILKRDEILQAYKTYNKNHKDTRLSTSDIGLNGPPNSIFMSEHLTYEKKRLFFLARDYAKTHNLQYCWTSYGRIFVRKQEGQPATRINTESDIIRMKTTI